MIDAHVHIWRLRQNECQWPTPDLQPIHRDFTLDDVAQTVAASGVERVVLVQSQESAADTEWLLGEAERTDIAAGVVGWIDPGDADLEARIDRLRRRPKLVGLRIMAQDRAPDWLASPGLQRQLANMQAVRLPLDLLVRPHHLPAAAALAARYPDLPMVIDHCAKPDIAGGNRADWQAELERAASFPNAMCKLSGLVTEAPPGAPVESTQPYIEAALAAFGPERLLWGSDWPVILLNGAYRDWLALVRSTIATRDHPAIFGGTARAFYKLAA